MGSRVNVCSVNVLNNPAPFQSGFELEITFEVFEYLPHDLDWELVYVGSGESTEYDQILDSAVVGPTPEGKHKFVLTAPAPDVSKIPVADVVGVTVLLLKCRYNGHDFLNLGWFVSNVYMDEELKENPPSTPIIEKLTRTVQMDDLRITSFPIKWGDEVEEEQPPQEEEPVAEEDLMPIEDQEQEDDEDDDDEEVIGDEEGVVDLDKSIEEQETAEAEQAAGDNAQGDDDVEMEEPEENSATPAVSNEKTTDSTATEAPLGDVTNGAEA